jgi:hypothetical protein
MKLTNNLNKTNLTNPYWYKLIKLFKTVEQPYKITTGLTIPFIFGAYSIFEEPFPDINTLIQSIVDSNIDKYPIIQRCDVIGKHVIMVEEKTKCIKEYKNFPRLTSTNGLGLLLISTNTSIGKTFDKVCNSLKLEYLGPINRNEFSWSNGKDSWRKFESREIELIKSVK